MASNENSLGLSVDSFMPENPDDPYWRKELLLIEVECSRVENFLSSEKFEANNKLIKDWLTELMRLAGECVAAEARGRSWIRYFLVSPEQNYLKIKPWC